MIVPRMQQVLEWRFSLLWITLGVDEGKALSEAASARREAADAVEEGCRKAAEFDHETDNLRRSLEKQRESYSTMYALVQVAAFLQLTDFTPLVSVACPCFFPNCPQLLCQTGPRSYPFHALESERDNVRAWVHAYASMSSRDCLYCAHYLSLFLHGACKLYLL